MICQIRHLPWSISVSFLVFEGMTHLNYVFFWIIFSLVSEKEMEVERYSCQLEEDCNIPSTYRLMEYYSLLQVDFNIKTMMCGLYNATGQHTW